MSQFVIGIKSCLVCARKIRQAETPPDAFCLTLCSPCYKRQLAGESLPVSDATKSQAIAIKPSQFLDIYRAKQKHEPIDAA